jgi:hypothetical protein
MFRELAVMQHTPRAVAAAVKPGADVPQIEPERLCEEAGDSEHGDFRGEAW